MSASQVKKTKRDARMFGDGSFCARLKLVRYATHDEPVDADE